MFIQALIASEEHYASPTSGEAYRDRRLTTNFELWVEIFCVPTCFHVRIPKPCLSVRLSVLTPRKEIIIASSISVYISNWCINRKVYTSTTTWRPENVIFFKSLKFEFWLVPKSWNHPTFVNISPTVVIDTSMERSSRVLQHGNINFFFFFQKNSKLNFDLYFVWLVFFF